MALTVYGAANVVAVVALGRRWIHDAERIYFVAWIISGLGLVAAACSSGMKMGIGSAFLAGLSGPVARVAVDTHIGRTVPRSDQPRVYALQRLALSGVSLIGLLVMSLVVLRLSADRLLGIAGGIIVLAGITGALWQRFADPEQPQLGRGI